MHRKIFCTKFSYKKEKSKKEDLKTARNFIKGILETILDPHCQIGGWCDLAKDIFKQHSADFLLGVDMSSRISTSFKATKKNYKFMADKSPAEIFNWKPRSRKDSNKTNQYYKSSTKSQGKTVPKKS